MLSTNLPVLILKDLILLPNIEIRIETRNLDIKKVVDSSLESSDNHILAIPYLKDDFKDNLDVLPKVGVLAEIVKKQEKSEDVISVVLKGINRVEVFKFNKTEDIIEAEIGHLEPEDINSSMEEALMKKTKENYKRLVDTNPNLSNSLLSIVQKAKNASELSDVLALNLNSYNERLVDYMTNPSSIERIKMILEDIKKEEEILEIDKKLDYELKGVLDKNQKDFILKEKLKLIKKELGESNNKDDDFNDLKKQIEELDAPLRIKERLEKELNRYSFIPQMSPELGIVRNYIEWLLNLPWENESEDNYNLKDVRELLDETHFGLEEAKDRIIEYLAVKQKSDKLKSLIICLTGPPGTGKTSLARSIAKSLNRSFVNISVGGIRDEAEITGHRRTYIGSSPGRIIQGMKKSNTINPVFLIDEIDKMGSDIKGDPTNALLDILDPEQNKGFSDNYIEEAYDLSKVMFITTANYLYQIPAPLRDRLEVIELTGYTDYEKLDIAQNHLLPKIFEEHNISKKKIIFREEAILGVIKNYTREAGARNLERELAKIVRKIITEMVYNNVEKKYIITEKSLPKYLGKKKNYHNKKNSKNQIGIANGLAYTPFGGDVLQIEVNLYKGDGKLNLTGSLGEVMKESAQIALSYLKAHYDEFGIDYETILKNDIHIHVPEGAVPKDGPSAGIALTTALLSAFTKKPILNDVGMTGEITLRGEVLPIGGLKQKSMGAYQGDLKKVLIPSDNKEDLDEISEEIKSSIEFVLVKNYKDVIDYAFETKL